MFEQSWDGYEAVATDELTTHDARLILWAAGGRLLADETLAPTDRQQGGEYLGFALDDIAHQEWAVARMAERHGALSDDPESSLFDLETSLRIAGTWIRMGSGTPLPQNVSPQAAGAREAMINTAVHISAARAQYRRYKVAQRQDPNQTRVNWR